MNNNTKCEENSYEKVENIKGLTDIEVEERVKEGKVNVIPKAPSRTTWQIIRANLFTVFNALNAVLALIVIIAGSPKNSIFAGVIITNTLIGIFQELRARKIIEKLSVFSSATLKVMRNGIEKDIAIEELVIDDIMILQTGSQVLCDAIVLENNELEVDESLLTGEADPILKKGHNNLLSGSFVVGGKGYAKAIKVGSDTYAAKLANEAKKFKKINSELQRAINKIFGVIIKFVIPISILLFTTQLMFTGTSWRDAVIGAVSGVIGMVPEGLVLLTSATFVVAIIRLSKWNTLVQELPATEVLARVDTLCLDKTGTITEGKLKLTDVITFNNNNMEDIEEVLSSICKVFSNTNPTQSAIADRFNKDTNLRVINKIAFSSARKWSAVEFEKKGTWILGAPEMILKNRYTEIKEAVEQEAIKGRRVLLLAKFNGESLTKELKGELEIAALILIEDIIREDAPEVLRYFNNQGVVLKIISGDNPITVSAVAKNAGVKNADKYIDATNLPDNIEELSRIVENITVFGRVTPHQKKNIVNALQKSEHVVAMTGDGVNDVLALKEADCGIAMANGSDATRAVAQLVLLDSNFSALPQVVMEGRRLINNLERVSELFLSKTVYSIILSFIFAIIFLPFPILPIQLSLIGSLTIGIPSFFLALGSNKERVKKGFLNRVLQFALPNGIVLAMSTLIMYLIAYLTGLQRTQCMTLSVLVLGGISLVVVNKVARPLNLFKILLIIAMSTLFAVAFLTPTGKDIFSLYNCGIAYNSIAFLIILLSLPIIGFVSKIVKKCLELKIISKMKRKFFHKEAK